jgi:hypothetical protein
LLFVRFVGEESERASAASGTRQLAVELLTTIKRGREKEQNQHTLSFFEVSEIGYRQTKDEANLVLGREQTGLVELGMAHPDCVEQVVVDVDQRRQVRMQLSWGRTREN